jgi:hypothetical protein
MKIQSWSQFQSADAAVRASRAAARQVGAMQDLATQAARSATAAEISVSRTDRPWVGVIGEVIVTPQSQEIAEFMHNPKLRLPLKYRQAIIGMKNYGPVPALHVNAVIEPVPVTDNADKDNLAIDRAYDYVCLSAGMDTRQMMDVGFYFIGPKEHREKVPFTSPARGAIVFPNEPVQESPSLEPWFEAEYAWPDLTGKKPFCLVGCIGYADKTARNQERDDVNRHVFFTRFCYVSQTPMDSITTPTPIGTKCGYNETAE